MNKYFILLLIVLACLAACSMPGLAATATPILPSATLLPTITPTLAPIPTQPPETLWTNPIDGALAAYIPPGEFIMGVDDDEPTCEPYDSDECIQKRLTPSEHPAHHLDLEAYWIYTTEVTNARYNLCIAAGSCQPPDQENKVYTNQDYAQHPVTSVNWYQAQDYCHWAGGRLPTEPEWEKAARGGLEGKIYPWGDQAPTCDLGAINGANFNSCFEDTLPVGSFSPNGYGLYDVAGNVYEWVSSLWKAYPYRYFYEKEKPLSNDLVVIRGGGWISNDSDHQLNMTRRAVSSPKYTDFVFGFRCVIPLQPES